jgi:Na+-driven multidrug efflux pump
LRPWALWTALIQGTNLALTFVLVGVLHMGAIGSAMATLIVTALGNPLLYWPLGRRLVGVSSPTWLRETIWPGFLPALSGMIVWVGLERLLRPATWLMLGACTAIGMAVYVMVLLRFCLRGPDRDALAAIIGKVRALLKHRR